MTKKYETGQSVTEYALILGLVAGIVIASLALLGPQVGDVFSRLFNTPEMVRVHVVDENGQGIEGIWVFEFDGSGAFSGNYGRTDADGVAEFKHEESGNFQYLAYQKTYFWSDTISFPQQSDVTIKLVTHQFTVRVEDENGKGIKRAYVYSVIPNGAYYAGAAGYTNGKGELKLDVPEGSYIFRVYYQGQYISSDTVHTGSQDSVTIVVKMDAVMVQVVNAAGNPQNRVRVYAYTGSGDYVGLHDRTDKNGQVTFDLTAGTYRFRADYRGSMYWSNTIDSISGAATIKID